MLLIPYYTHSHTMSSTTAPAVLLSLHLLLLLFCYPYVYCSCCSAIPTSTAPAVLYPYIYCSFPQTPPCTAHILRTTLTTLHLVRTSGKRANIWTAKKTMTNAWRAEGSRDARHTEAKMAAFREMALDTLKEEVSMEKFNGSWRFAADCSYDPPLTWDIRNKAAWTGDHRSLQEITGVYRRLLEFTGDYWSLLEITGVYRGLLFPWDPFSYWSTELEPMPPLASHHACAQMIPYPEKQT